MPSKDKKSSSGAAYPTQQPVGMQPQPYPVNPSYNLPPSVPTYPNAPPQPYYTSTPGMPPPPPSYDQAMHHPVAPPNYVPQQNQVPHNSYQQVYYQQPHPHPQPQYVQPIPPQATYVVPNAFDAGARFDSTSQVRIPPPPPGVAPNMAQIASASGQNVVVSQRPDKWFMGGSDGGAVFW